MDGHRRAALALHGLLESDRCWVLDRLRDVERARLALLVEELQKLGIPPDPSLLADAQERLPAAPATSRIREASAAQMSSILAREPAGLIAAVLRIEPWPWQARLLARLDRPLRETVVAELRTEARMTEKFAATLRSCIEARLSTKASAEPGRVSRFAARARGHVDRVRGAFSGRIARWAR